MTTPEERCPLTGDEGIRQAVILPFDQELARLTPEEFVRARAGGESWARGPCWWARISGSGTARPATRSILAELGRALRLHSPR